MEISEKTCSKCKVSKKVSQFYTHHKARYQSHCNDCKREIRDYKKEYQLKLKRGISEEDRKKRREYAKLQRQLNPWKKRHYEGIRRARKNNATPSWADLDAIKEFYKNCPAGYEVDHIIPLLGQNVCGLHVLSNLQYLLKTDNRRKGNKYYE